MVRTSFIIYGGGGGVTSYEGLWDDDQSLFRNLTVLILPFRRSNLNILLYANANLPRLPLFMFIVRSFGFCSSHLQALSPQHLLPATHSPASGRLWKSIAVELPLDLQVQIVGLSPLKDLSEALIMPEEHDIVLPVVSEQDHLVGLLDDGFWDLCEARDHVG